MLIHTKKSNSLRIEPRHDRVCVNIATENGCQLQWVDEIRYLGILLFTVQNLNVLLTMLNAHSIRQQMEFLVK